MAHGLKTPTLAKLYLEQGHAKRAKAMLEELLLIKPEDNELLALLEQAVQMEKYESSDNIDNTENIGNADDNKLVKNNFEASYDEVKVRDFASDQSYATQPTFHAPLKRKSYQANEVPQTSIKEKAIELGVAVVDQLTEKAIGKLTSMLGKIRDRRR